MPWLEPYIAAECAQSYNRCGSCGEKGHRTSACTSSSTFCANCETDNHTSWSRECPTFVRKYQEFDAKHPENNLPYYSSTEPWTWAAAPQRQEVEQFARPAPPPPITTRPAMQKLRQAKL